MCVTTCGIFLPRCQRTICTLQWCLCNPCGLPSNYRVCWGGGFNASGSRTDVWCRHPSVFPAFLIWCGLASPQLSTLYLHKEPCKCRGLASVSATDGSSVLVSSAGSPPNEAHRVNYWLWYTSTSTSMCVCACVWRRSGLVLRARICNCKVQSSSPGQEQKKKATCVVSLDKALYSNCLILPSCKMGTWLRLGGKAPLVAPRLPSQ